MNSGPRPFQKHCCLSKITTPSSVRTYLIADRPYPIDVHCCGRIDQPLNEECADPGKEPTKKDGLGLRKMRACPTCGTELSGAMKFCPVCLLRQALDRESEPGESALEPAVKPVRELASRRFQHYELVIGEDGKPIELGRGAMGVTYKAFEVDLRVPVTLKLISDKYVGDDVAFLGWLPDGPSLQVFKPDPEFQAFLSEREKKNAKKRARILATEKSYQE